MNLLVISYKTCWPDASSPSGYATDGGFPIQMRALSELFSETRLLIPCERRAEKPGAGALVGNRLSVIPLPEPGGGSGWKRKLAFPWWLLRSLPRLLVEVLRADAIHTPIPGDIGTIGMLLAFVLRKRLFIRYCGNWQVQTTPAEHFWKWFMERTAGQRTICLATGGGLESPSRRNPMLAWIFATTIPREELCRCGTHPRFAPGNPPRLIIACRQEREKGTGLVIESLPLLEASFPGIRFDVVGDGGARREFEALAARLGLQERVTFHGQVNHDRVLELLQQADLFCFPTTSSEGFPKAVIEAMACGLPVVTNRVSVLPYLISADCGVLIEAVTPEAVAHAARACLADTAHYAALSQAARNKAQAFTLEAWRDAIGDRLRAAWGSLR